jgi:hypothetical protein
MHNFPYFENFMGVINDFFYGLSHILDNGSNLSFPRDSLGLDINRPIILEEVSESVSGGSEIINTPTDFDKNVWWVINISGYIVIAYICIEILNRIIN